MIAFDDAIVGAAFGALIQAILTAKERAYFFKKTLEHLEETIKSVYPIVREILKAENVSNDTCKRFQDQLERAKLLVEMYSDISKWKLLKKHKVKQLIRETDATLGRILSRDFQAEQLLVLAIIDNDVEKMNRKIDYIITMLEKKNHGEENPGACESIPEAETEETSSSASTPEAKNEKKPFKSTFELHLKIKERYLDICFRGRHHR